MAQISCYRVMNRKGIILNDAHNPKLDKSFLMRIYKTMAMLSKFDVIMYEAQRQGRVSFYMQNHGETAAQLGSASALDPDDMVFGECLSLNLFCLF